MDSYEQMKQAAKIRVVGAGGAGCNAVNTMIAASLDRVDFIAANTDILWIDFLQTFVKGALTGYAIGCAAAFLTAIAVDRCAHRRAKSGSVRSRRDTSSWVPSQPAVPAVPPGTHSCTA